MTPYSTLHLPGKIALPKAHKMGRSHRGQKISQTIAVKKVKVVKGSVSDTNKVSYPGSGIYCVTLHKILFLPIIIFYVVKYT